MVKLIAKKHFNEDELIAGYILNTIESEGMLPPDCEIECNCGCHGGQIVNEWESENEAE